MLGQVAPHQQTQALKSNISMKRLEAAVVVDLALYK